MALRRSKGNIYIYCYDGDAVGIMLMLDDLMTQNVSMLEPHNSVFDMSKPRAPSNVMAIPKPVIANINNWYYHQPPVTSVSQMNRFLV